MPIFLRENKRGSSQHHKTVCQGSQDGGLNWYPLSQQAPGAMQGEALDLIITTCPKLTGPE